MEKKEINELSSAFQINNILLIESRFKRIPNVTFNNPEIKREITIDIEVNVIENKVSVSESLSFKQTFKDEEEVSAFIKMFGDFEKKDDSPLDTEEFGKINGSAIIYPYIREHFSQLTAKAGLGLIFLPPVNFVKMKSESQTKI
ncbi:protein-export chaperone SecB [Seramator thermalis]|uniref:protein-export chaperone SecB n=1 Tax=Seramator thermalis TaxID=2496270 RepID=UPI00101DD319|nr:protein-export chaperone SecB [Seramator thermalis]